MSVLKNKNLSNCKHNRIERALRKGVLQRSHKGFTLLELLVTLLLGTLLLLLIYQVFGKVAKDFLAFQQGKDFALFIKVSEGLRRQLEHLDESRVNIGGLSGKLFSFRGNTLAFLTNFGPGGKIIAIYHNAKEGLIYAELIYTGKRLSPNLLAEAKDLPNPPIFYLPGMKISILQKTEEGLKELSSWQGIPSREDNLILKITSGSHERLIPIIPRP